MEHKRIITVLICVLVASCVIVSGYVISINRESRYLPDKSVEDIVKILADENISIDPQLISTKTEVGNVYICGSPEEYSSTVAGLIEDCGVRYSFAVPDGDIIIMTNGARFEFGSEFSFRYSENGEEVSLPTRDKLPQMSTPLSEKTKNEISDAVYLCLKNTDGVMVFELSHVINFNTWDGIKEGIERAK